MPKPSYQQSLCSAQLDHVMQDDVAAIVMVHGIDAP
jgi:hypothetical protein